MSRETVCKRESVCNIERDAEEEGRSRGVGAVFLDIEKAARAHVCARLARSGGAEPREADRTTKITSFNDVTVSEVLFSRGLSAVFKG